jgi:tetratricopeptide (TPR) repeat protein
MRPDKDYCFVLMPFARRFDNEWNLVFAPAIRETGFVPWRGDDEQLGSNMIMRDISDSIYHASIIIAHLAELNANVMYELGLAHAAKKRVIVVARKDENIPFDLAHIRYLPYEPDNLAACRADLVKRIKSTMASNRDRIHDQFPELQIMTPEDSKELAYFRSNLPTVEVITEPAFADIFFNDEFRGNSPVRLQIQPRAERNTISVAALEHLEKHVDIAQSDIAAGKMVIRLDRRRAVPIQQQAMRWLRDWKRNPRNPVLMRAVCHYLHTIHEREEATREGEELLKVAPDWYLAHNQVGYIIRDTDPQRALKHFETVRALKPKYFIGYYNAACVYANQGQFEACLAQLRAISSDPEITRTFLQLGASLDDDSDFETIRKDPAFAARFEEVTKALRTPAGES